MSDFDFHYKVENFIATITLDRPDVYNALTLKIYAQLRGLFEDLRYDNTVRVVVITGTGKAFCSGGDVHEIIGVLLESDMREHLEFTRMTGALVGNMRLLEKPIVAAINGVAAGAGAVIALASDFRVMSEKAKFAFLFSRVGLTGADMGSGYLLPRIVGSGRAMEILMLGDDLDSETSLNIGLVNRVTAPDEVLSTAMDLAHRLAEGPFFAHGLTKRMVNNEWNMDLVSALEAEAQAQALMMMGEDHKIFYEAFKRKEPPKFQGR